MTLINSTTIIILFIFPLLSFADPQTDLAKKAQNPVEDIISLPFNNSFNFNFGPLDRTQYNLEMKPIIPFELNKDWNLITRTIVPFYHQPSLIPPYHNYIHGIGDINPIFYLSPAHPGKLIWGVDPSLILPTADNSTAPTDTQPTMPAPTYDYTQMKSMPEHE